jgi:hypothetical protein
MVLYDDSSEVHFQLDTFLTNEAVHGAILASVYTGGGIDIAGAMNTAITQVFFHFAFLSFVSSKKENIINVLKKTR